MYLAIEVVVRVGSNRGILEINSVKQYIVSLRLDRCPTAQPELRPLSRGDGGVAAVILNYFSGRGVSCAWYPIEVTSKMHKKKALFADPVGLASHIHRLPGMPGRLIRLVILHLYILL